MNKELMGQRRYWDNEVNGFDAIYSHGKSRFANWLDAKFRWDMYARFDYTMKHSEPIKGCSFLDVGCGTGHYSLEFSRHGAQKVVGIDISDRMVAVCQERAKAEHQDDRCRFIVSDLLQYEPDGLFDTCIGIGLFDYIREPQTVLSKMKKVVQDKAIMTFHRFWTWRAPVRKMRLALRGCDVFFYTKEKIDTLLKQAGFAKYTMDQVGQLYCVTAFVKKQS